jgi:hypothetical protein
LKRMEAVGVDRHVYPGTISIAVAMRAGFQLSQV